MPIFGIFMMSATFSSELSQTGYLKFEKGSAYGIFKTVIWFAKEREREEIYRMHNNINGARTNFIFISFYFLIFPTLGAVQWICL